MSESQLVKTLLRNLQRRKTKKLLGLASSQDIQFHREVGGSAFLADICISIRPQKKVRNIHNSDVSFIAIEVKISDWQNGLYQAWRYNNFAEKSYLAIYKPYAAKVKLEEFENNNIGLIIFDEKNVDIEYQPRTNIFKKNTYQSDVRGKIWQNLLNSQSICPAF